MDLRAVVALAVVLDRDLPVRGELVGVRRSEHEVFRPVAVDDDLEVAEVRRELGRVAARVAEEPAVPFLDPRVDERELAFVERVHVEARRRTQVPLETVDPRVVRTADPSLRPSLADRRAARAHGDGRRCGTRAAAVVAAHQQEAVVADGDRGLRSRRAEVEVCRATDAHPGALEQVALLPREDLRGRVGVGRQGACAVVRLQHPFDAREIQGGGGALHGFAPEFRRTTGW